MTVPLKKKKFFIIEDITQEKTPEDEPIQKTDNLLAESEIVSNKSNSSKG